MSQLESRRAGRYEKSPSPPRPVRGLGLSRRPVRDPLDAAAVVRHGRRLHVPPRDRASGRRSSSAISSPRPKHDRAAAAARGRCRPRRAQPAVRSSQRRSSGTCRTGGHGHRGDAARDRAQFWLARWQAIIGGPATSILGPTLVGADELAAWFNAKPPPCEHDRAHRGAHPLLRRGRSAAVGVRADIAFAQSMLETGGFSFPAGGQVLGTDNNFAGMGACDSCHGGNRFPDARTGVRAQLQQLRVYADATSPTRRSTRRRSTRSSTALPEGQGDDLGRPHPHVGDGGHLRRPDPRDLRADARLAHGPRPHLGGRRPEMRSRLPSGHGLKQR